jgi:hypothetical protein
MGFFIRSAPRMRQKMGILIPGIVAACPADGTFPSSFPDLLHQHMVQIPRLKNSPQDSIVRETETGGYRRVQAAALRR